MIALVRIYGIVNLGHLAEAVNFLHAVVSGYHLAGQWCTSQGELFTGLL